jgi:hypothetical protein
MCRDYEARWSEARRSGFEKERRDFRRICAATRRLGREFDCLVPLSGGKDSTYVLYAAKRMWGLKPLAVNFDNLWQTTKAARNIARAVEALDVDLFVYRPRWDVMRRLYRLFLLEAGEFCAPCNMGINMLVWRLAERLRIPLILTGNSPRSDECSPPEIYHCSPPYFLRVLAAHGETDAIRGTVFSEAERLTSFSFRLRRRVASRLGLMARLNVPRKLDLPAFMDWREQDIFATIRRELGWEESEVGKEHTDCLMNPVKCHLRHRRWGFGSKTQKLAALVRDGQLDRDEALELVSGEEAVPEALHTMLARLGLEAGDLEKIYASNHTTYV